MANLYEITREALELASLLEIEELTPELEAALVINQEQLQAKAVNYAKVIANIQSDADAIDTEIKRLKAMKESKERAIDRLKDAVKNAMLVSGIDKIESPLFKLALRRSESVEVDLVEALPSDFRTIKNVVTADKIAIKEAIKRGENVIGARLIENFNLQIKWDKPQLITYLKNFGLSQKIKWFGSTIFKKQSKWKKSRLKRLIK